MPFKSKAQIKKFREMVKTGEISQEKFDQWMTETKNPKALPERKSPKSSGPKSTRDLKALYRKKFG